MRALALAPVLGLAVASLACGSSEKNPNDVTAASTDSPAVQVAEPAAVVAAPSVSAASSAAETPASAAQGASADQDPAPAPGEAPSGSEGRPAPSFSLSSITTKGKVGVALGKVTIVDFWATYCAPCRKSFPELQALYVKYKAKGLEIASVNVDEEDNTIAAFARDTGAKFPIGWDKDMKIAGLYKPPMMPTTFVVDKTGVIRHIHAGYRDGTIAAIEAQIKDLL